jgi:ketosteroid isomerase-like protein
VEEARSDAGLSQADLDVVHRVVDAFARRDAEAMNALYGDSFEFHSTLAALEGDSAVYRGRADVDRYFRDLDDAFQDWQIREHVCVDADDGRVVLVYRIAGQGRASGVPVEHDFGICFQLRDGLLVRGDTHVDPDDALEAAGLRRSLGEELQMLRDYGAAIAAGDLDRGLDLLHPDAIWEHNLGTGSPEEGVYQGRDAIAGLFTRIVEVWEYIWPETRDVIPSETGYRVFGVLHTKHRLTAAEVATTYEQHFEVRDGLIYRARMTIGEGLFQSPRAGP